MSREQSAAVHKDGALEAEVAALFAGKRMADPFPILNAAREAAAVYPVGGTFLVGRYEDVQTVLSDQELYSNELFIRGSRVEEIVATFTPDGQRKFRELAEQGRLIITRSLPEDHARRRGAVHRYFTPRRLAEMVGTIQHFVDELLDEAAQQDVYDQKRLAGDLAMSVVSHMIGTPQIDREYIRGIVNTRGRGIGTEDENVLHEAYDAHWELDAYVRETIIAEHRRNPGSNELAAALLAAEADERLSQDEFVAIVFSLVLGGLHTTASLLSVGMLELMRHRGQWELLCADPELVDSAVEELMRYASPSQLSERIALRDFSWQGVEIPAEATLKLALAAANRDPRAYEHAEVFDVTRNPHHLALGHGAHYCLGASVIRSEARILIRALATRYPDLELAVDPDDLDWSAGSPHVRSIAELPLRLGPRR